MALKKPCAKIGCSNTIPIGKERYCQNCKPREIAREAKQRKEAYRIYNKTKRNPKVTKWLSSQRYKDVRKRFLAANPLCVECLKDTPTWPGGRAEEAKVLDHITPHKGDYNLFWDRSNWQALCHRCHNRKTNSKDGGFGNPIQ